MQTKLTCVHARRAGEQRVPFRHANRSGAALMEATRGVCHVCGVRTGSANMESWTDCSHSVRLTVLKSFSRNTPASMQARPMHASARLITARDVRCAHACVGGGDVRNLRRVAHADKMVASSMAVAPRTVLRWLYGAFWSLPSSAPPPPTPRPSPPPPPLLGPLSPPGSCITVIPSVRRASATHCIALRRRPSMTTEAIAVVMTFI